MTDEVGGYLVELVHRGKTPGVQCACVDSSGTIRTQCAGWADLRERRPVRDQTPMMAYSMSKVLTAYAVSTLAREGHVRLDDAVEHYWPGFPYGAAVTVRHLVEHRSGIPNPLPLRWVHPAASHAGFDEQAALESVVRRHRRLKFRPGSRRLYSNIGYWLLGRIVEHVAGLPFVAYMEALLRSAGITASAIAYRFPADESQARGYLERYSLLNLLRPLLADRWVTGESAGRWVRMQDHYVNGPAFGGAIGTAAGFCQFAQRLLECGELGFEWSDRPDLVQKEGGGAGFHCMLRLDHRNRRASVIMANATGLDVRGCLDRLGWA